jgi:hypothetical protein
MGFLLGDRHIASLNKLAESDNAKAVVLPSDLPTDWKSLFRDGQP